MGEAARRSAVERYTTEQIIPQYLDYYREVIESFEPGTSVSSVGRYVR